MVPVVRIISGITFVFTIYLHSLSIANFVYFNVFRFLLSLYLSLLTIQCLSTDVFLLH